MEPLVIRPRRWKMALFALFALSIAAVATWALTANLDPVGEPPARWNPAVWIAAPLFAAVGVLLLWQLARRTPLIVLDADGITIGQVGVTLRWEEVRELAFVERTHRTFYGRRLAFLAVRPHDEDAVAALLPRAKALWVAINTRSWLQEPLVVPLNTLPMSREQLREILGRYFDGPIHAPRSGLDAAERSP